MFTLVVPYGSGALAEAPLRIRRGYIFVSEGTLSIAKVGVRCDIKQNVFPACTVQSIPTTDKHFNSSFSILIVRFLSASAINHRAIRAQRNSEFLYLADFCAGFAQYFQQREVEAILKISISILVQREQALSIRVRR